MNSSTVRAIILHYALLLVGSVWPLMLWVGVLFGGQALATLRGEAFIAFTKMAGGPVLCGAMVILLLPIPWRNKLLPIVSFCLPFLLVSLYMYLRIYVTHR